jgi:hypothetical protein
MDYLLGNKRKVGIIIGAALIIIPYLTMGFMSDGKGEITFSFIQILFPGKNIFHQSFNMLLYVVYPILILIVISAILNLFTERFVILSAIVGILALGLHILFYFWVAEAFSAATLGTAWYIMGVGFILLIASPFLKKSNVKSADTND